MTIYKNFRWGFSGEPQEMAVENGRVARRGRPSDDGDESAETVDLGGRFLLPAFIDAHCHILPTGLDLKKLSLAECQTPEAVLDAVRDRARELSDGGWLLAVLYDQTKFSTGRHLTRDDLDHVCPERPALLRHVSGHASVANSAALEAARIADDVPDPRGGSFVRDASGRLTGVLLETAHDLVSSSAPRPSLDGMADAILLAGEKMSALGVSCAADMMTGHFDLETELEAYRLAEARGCPIRVRLYPIWSAVFGANGIGKDRLESIASGFPPERLRIAGIKLFADGAIGACTAAIYGRFTPSGPTQNGEEDVDGQLIYPPEELKRRVRVASDAGYQVAIHSIGDHSTDLVMDAVEATGDPSRHRIEHAMLLSDAQIERLAGLGCHVTMQPEFLMRLGGGYRRNLGEERAARLKRFRSVWDAGIVLSLNSDRPVVAGDPWDGIRTAASRPEGFEPAENLTLSEAILGYTARAAEATNDGETMGSLAEGQLADFRVYDYDPLARR